jgi:TIR domain-containing protein
MHKVFINYRTGDGGEAAALLENALSTRFGKDEIFRAAKSIPPGASYADRLLDAVRHSTVLIVVIGPDWPADPRLHHENDWVRREILEAYDCGVRVLPVLKGRATARLKADLLPAELQRLADVQSLRLDMRDNGADLKRIGDELAALIPSFKDTDQASSAPTSGATHNSVGQADGTVVQSHHITGDVGTVVKGNQGPVHAGQGDLNYNSPRFSGDRATYVNGDNHGGVGHQFGGSRDNEDER